MDQVRKKEKDFESRSPTRHQKEQTKDRYKKRKQRIGNELGKNLARKGFEKKGNSE